jgi:outer membrane lipoprotein SlyB
MMTRTLIALVVAPALVLGGCVTTTTRTTTWGDASSGNWARYGRVESIRETVDTQNGDPAAGAVAGAIIGGLIGSTFGGHTYVDRWGRAHRHGNGAGTLVGAVGGAMVGAAASQGQGEDRSYEVFVRFDDGALESFLYRNVLPFRVGDPVALTAQGLGRQ